MTSHEKTCKQSLSTGPLIGRILLSLIFILAGMGKLFLFKESAPLLQKSFGSWAPLALSMALAIEIIGGFLILLGWWTRVAALILMLFLIPTTLLFHNFWDYQGVEAANQMANFLKNVAIFGGLLLLASYGPGRYSLDTKFRCSPKNSSS